ncbi:MAG: hypothetical protein QUV05_23395, partial [Phycisphaerae bacterium]|nr:hypothetical protein [Phycisphaerae bacterium]
MRLFSDDMELILSDYPIDFDHLGRSYTAANGWARRTGLGIGGWGLEEHGRVRPGRSLNSRLEIGRFQIPVRERGAHGLSLIHISEPTRQR